MGEDIWKHAEKFCNFESWSIKNYLEVLNLFLPIFKGFPVFKHNRQKYAASEPNDCPSLDTSNRNSEAFQAK